MDNEQRKTKDLEEKLKEYRKAVEENGDFLTPKKRDLIVMDVLESTIDMRYLFIDLHSRIVNWDAAEKNKAEKAKAEKDAIPERTWFIQKVLPGLVQTLITSIVAVLFALIALHFAELL